MDVVSHLPPDSMSGVDAVLDGIRRLRRLGDTSPEGEPIFAALAHELMETQCAEEVHVHHLFAVPDQELVVVHLLGGDGKLSYLQPREERPPGVSWVESTARPFLAVGPRELSASLPRVDAACALLLPLSIAGQVESVVVLVRFGGDPFTERSIEQASALVDQAAAALALARARTEAGTDSVAGCMNHRAMRRRLSEEIARARRSGEPLSCLMIDLDDFKLVNDRHGHHAGDTLLREISQALMGEFRAFDRVARYGGDEFVAILPQADIEAASAAGARALGRLKGVGLSGGAKGVSASIGVAQWREPMDVDELLQACDAALLQRKRAGKGGVTRAGQASFARTGETGGVGAGEAGGGGASGSPTMALDG